MVNSEKREIYMYKKHGLFLGITVLFSTFTVMGWLFVSSAHGAADQDDRDAKASPLFQSHEPLTLLIKAPFREIHKSRGIERPYHAAGMSLTGNDGKEVLLDLEIRVRGKSRAKPKTCTYPPLKLNFKRKSLTNTVFDGENKLKLITQCKKSSSYEQYLLLEYLNYRVLQLFTDYALRVRLVQISYYDSDRGRDLGTRPAFFLEDIGRMAKRVGLKELKIKRMKARDYDPAMLNLVDVYEYFLGNTDWSVIVGPPEEGCCHNIVPLQGKDGPVIPVPYDFDATGVVNPPYVLVSEKLPIKSLKQRLYRGFCQSGDIYQATIAAFLDKRNEITALYENQPGLSTGSRKSALRYYDHFYNTIQDEKKLKRAILDKCRSKPG
jgi:hypothetical protein